MIYLTPTELLEYKIWFDLSWYTEAELEVYIDIAQWLIDDYIWYSIDYSPIVDELGQWVIQKDWQLFISLKSRDIDTISSLQLNTYWDVYTEADITYINLFSKPWYFYLNTVSEYFIPIFHALKPWRVDYKISYTKQDKWIPSTIKFAVSKVVWNLLRADYNLTNWVAWTDWTIQSFTSWDYSVKLSGSTLAYKWIWNNWWSVNNLYIDDWVKSLLYKLKRTWQNTY